METSIFLGWMVVYNKTVSIKNNRCECCENHYTLIEVLLHDLKMQWVRAITRPIFCEETDFDHMLLLN